MNLKKLLYPEIIKNRRGPESLRFTFGEMKKCYRQILPHTWITESDDPMLGQLLSDRNISLFMPLAIRHEKTKAPTYHVCREFLETLKDIPDREVPIEYLPDNHLSYISFAEGVLTDGYDPISGCYVYCGTTEPDWVPLAADAIQRVGDGKILMLSFTYDVDEDEENQNPPFHRLVVDIQKGDTIENLYSKIPHDPVSVVGQPSTVLMGYEDGREDQIRAVKAILNTILYIESEDPVLLELTPAYQNTHSQKNKKIVRGHLNEASVPVTAVNWDYRSLQHLYEDGISSVRSHWRWQRCGANFSKIKLTLVREHERSVRKRKEDN